MGISFIVTSIGFEDAGRLGLQGGCILQDRNSVVIKPSQRVPKTSKRIIDAPYATIALRFWSVHA
jgi:hypothetical protein